MHICEDLFHQLFHNISKIKSTTTLRQELRVVVSEPVANAFFAELETILEGGSLKTEPRDVIAEKGMVAVTSTNYTPAVFGVDELGKRVFKAQIRTREYHLVPEGTKTDDLGDLLIYAGSKLADGPGDYVRLEFKVGHPMVSESGKLKEMKLVVDKAGLVIDRADAIRLLKDRATFDAFKEEISQRAKALTFTTASKVLPVNSSEGVDSIINRIGEIHAELGLTKAMESEMNVRYFRNAIRIVFPIPETLRVKGGPVSFEVQITRDEQVRTTELNAGVRKSLKNENDRVIELKIPVEYASRTDEELTELGLIELVKIRHAYQELPHREGTVRNKGKRKQVE